jgi:hypothetical protein
MWDVQDQCRPTFAGSASNFGGYSSVAISTIVTSFGDSAPSTASHFSDLQQSNVAAFVDCTAAHPPLFACLNFPIQHLSTVAKFLSQQTAAEPDRSGWVLGTRKSHRGSSAWQII